MARLGRTSACPSVLQPYERNRIMPRARFAPWFVVWAVLLIGCSDLAMPAAPTDTAPSKARLYLVGVGPGDADLITLRAIEAIRQAQVVFCTDGIEKKFASYVQGKEVVTGYWRLFEYYGKDPAQLQGPEREACQRIAARRDEFISKVRRAIGEGKTVAILDHGDPLLYGPWAWCLEEFEDLHPVVVPGLSCFNAANAALARGITNSQQTKSVILTANDWPGKTDTIEKLSVHGSTMVLFTMRAEFSYFIEQLARHYPPQTPVAVVKYAGYRDKEEVIRGKLGTIVEQIGPERLPFEYLLYVGDFLEYRHKPAGPKSAPSKAPQAARR